MDIPYNARKIGPGGVQPPSPSIIINKSKQKQMLKMMNKSKQKIRSWGCVQEKPAEGRLKFLKGLAQPLNVTMAQRDDIVFHLTGERRSS